MPAAAPASATVMPSAAIAAAVATMAARATRALGATPEMVAKSMFILMIMVMIHHERYVSKNNISTETIYLKPFKCKS
jgi:hypothetical protein